MGVCAGRRKTWAFLTLLSADLLLAAGVYLFISVHDLVQSLTCVLSIFSDLSSSAAAATIGSAAVSRLPTGFISTSREVVPYLDFAALLPAIFSMLLLLASGALGCGCISKKSFYCAKCLVLLSNVALFLTLCFYVVLSTVALLADRPLFTTQWDSFTEVCTDSLPELQLAQVQARNAVDNLIEAGATPGEVATARSSLASAVDQLADFQRMCTCLGEVPPRLLLLRGAGLAGLLTTLFAFVAVNGMCVAAGCCRKPRSRVAPDDASTAKAPAPTADEDEDEDEDEDDKSSE